MAVLINGNEIVLSGMVGDDFWGDGFTSGQVISALAQVGRDSPITIRLNSGGGIATEGAAIHAALKAHKGQVTVVVEGIAASAASLIAVAGDAVQMALGAVMMIHDPATVTWGTVSDHQASIAMLESLASSYAETYADKTGGSAAAMRTLMKAETWLTADQAIAQRFADGLVAANSNEPAEPTAFAYGVYAKAPQQIVALADAKGWKARNLKPAAALAASPATAPPAAAPPATPVASTPPAAPAAQPAKQEPTMADTPNETEIRTDERTKATADATARVQAILTSDEAQGRGAMAQHLAFATAQTAEEAIALLKAAPKADAGDSADPTAAFMQRKEGQGDGLGVPAGQPSAQASRAGWKKAVADVNRTVRR